MSAGTPLALAIVRVARGEGRPGEAVCRAALCEDRARLREPEPAAAAELAVAGPYAVFVDGVEVDEYVVWAR